MFVPSKNPDAVLHPSDVPRGWTTNPKEMDYENEWAADNSMGQQITRGWKLGDRAYLIMFHPLGFSLMFMAGGKFYVLNHMSCRLDEITSPTSLDGIISAMKESGIKSFTFRMIQ